MFNKHENARWLYDHCSGHYSDLVCNMTLPLFCCQMVNFIKSYDSDNVSNIQMDLFDYLGTRCKRHNPIFMAPICEQIVELVEDDELTLEEMTEIHDETNALMHA